MNFWDGDHCKYPLVGGLKSTASVTGWCPMNIYWVASEGFFFGAMRIWALAWVSLNYGAYHCTTWVLAFYESSIPLGNLQYGYQGPRWVWAHGLLVIYRYKINVSFSMLLSTGSMTTFLSTMQSKWNQGQGDLSWVWQHGWSSNVHGLLCS